MYKFPIIVFEGVEGSGKSFHLKNIKKYFKKKKIKYLSFREPGGSKNAEKIRKLILNKKSKFNNLTDLLLYLAARNENFHNILSKHYKRKVILIDRFTDSTIAYQGYGHGINKKALKQLQQFIAGNIEPDMTIILDLPIKVGLERAEKRMKTQINAKKNNEDRYERMNIDFHERLRKGFLSIAKNNLKRCVVIDTTRSIEEIQTTIEQLDT